MDGEQESSKKLVIGVVVFIIIAAVAVGAYYFAAGRRTAETERETSGEEGTAVTTTTEINRLVVTDQFPGTIVYISAVELADNGFVVIHRESTDGKPGEIVGSEFFDRGTNPGQITLVRTTNDMDSYFAMLHKDDGDGRFNAAKDLPIKDSKGQVIMLKFRVTKELPEIKS